MTLRLVQGSDTHTPEYPWEPVTLNEEDELTTNTADVESQRVNMFGIEAQPFVIEAASYAFWMDVSHFAALVNGETQPHDEWRDGDPDGPGGPIPREDVPITIDHTVSFQNADFLGEIVAFQVTNPFDRDIYITRAGANGPKFLYYVEYAHRYFPLAELQSGGSGGGGVTFRNADLKLGPNETRVFYATSPRKEFNFNARMTVGLAANTAPPPAGFLKAWVDRQFRKTTETGTTREPLHTTMFDPETFALIAPEAAASDDPENGLMDLHGEHTSPPAVTDDRRVVKLWRVMHSEMSENDTSNLKSNDLLADRLRDPAALGTATLFQRLDSGTNDEVPGTIAGPDDPPGTGGGGPGGNPKDNTGYSVTMWGAIRRPTNPDAMPDHSPRGAMPPWCIEAREDQSYTFAGRTSLNKDFDGPGGRGSKSDYGGADSRYRTFNALMADQAGGDGGSKVNTEIREKAENKRLNTIPDSQAIDTNGMQRKFNQQAVRIALGGKDASGHIWNSALFRRAGDLLLPLAICPYSDPMHSGAPDEMTLSEILALATDYYSPASTHLYFQAGHFDLSSTPRVYSKLDAGHFVLDNFVPYYDANHNGMYDPSAGNLKEAPLGLGIPVALNLLDKFRLDNFGNKAQGATGKVNINTATLTTLSMLPLLTPDPLADWMVKADAGQEREPIYQPDMQQSDRAASVVAYRDKVDMRTRPLLDAPGVVANPRANTTLEVSFRDSTNTPRFTQPWMQDGRRTHTLIEGLREGLGFRSPGEILAVVLRDQPANLPYRSNSMDWYGYDTLSFKGQRGIEPDNVPVINGNANQETSDEVVDDYGEKVAIANAVINSISTRSDCFCVWFILNGYQPSDVQVGPNDPLIPTFAKRFMMIVDRSNIIKKGDKPRILMFREVPM
jgi:hypothetical protein